MIRSLRVRFPRLIYDQVRADLTRAHEHAGERVGFLSTSFKAYPDGTYFLLINGYDPVPDEAYIPDQQVGARIDSFGIRTALQRILDTKRGAFHIHLHGGAGIPHLSRIDQEQLPRLVESLRVTGPQQAHGIFLLSKDTCTCWVWLPGETTPISPELITIVGYPMEFIQPTAWPLATEKEQFTRQSFLGALSQTWIETARIGIVGLGGGGSHVVQQLAHIGIRYFHIFDGDQADQSNLNRLVGSLFSDPETQSAKTKIARRVITGINPDAMIREQPGPWQNHPDLLEQCDLVFGCIDTLAGRRDLETTCRRYLIPYIDIGMDVYKVEEEPPRMAGQVILSMPGQLCMQCLEFLNETELTQEAAHYGQIGGRPQVIWANGVLASSAVGIGLDLLTGWTGRKHAIIFLSYDGNSGTLIPHRRLPYLAKQACIHFPFAAVGPPVWR